MANKIDLEERRVVDEQRGRDFAKENGLVYFETSALQGNYEGPFRHVVLTQRLFPSTSQLEVASTASSRRQTTAAPSTRPHESLHVSRVNGDRRCPRHAGHGVREEVRGDRRAGRGRLVSKSLT